MEKPYPHTQPEIVEATQRAWKAVADFVASQPDAALHYHPAPEVWSAMENLDHLILSAKPVAGGLKLPKVAFKIYGKPNRPVRGYEDLISRYQDKLTEGYLTPAPYDPQGKDLYDKEAELANWESLGRKIAERLYRWSEQDLDRFLAPHPLLGKLMLREVLFFTIHHTWHHLRLMEKRVTAWQEAQA